jgi:hypothetical protein
MKASNAISASTLVFGHQDVLQRTLGFQVLALRQIGQHVCSLVDPASLLAGFRPDLAERLPGAKRTVGDRQLRRILILIVAGFSSLLSRCTVIRWRGPGLPRLESRFGEHVALPSMAAIARRLLGY